MSLKFPRRRLLLAAIMTGVVVFITPVIFYPACLPGLPPDDTEWLSKRVGLSIGPPGGDIRALCMAPSDPERLYAGTVNGHIFASKDGAGSWIECPLEISRDAVISRIAVDPRSPDVAYAAYWLHDGGGGILKSFDGGQEWDEIDLPSRPALRALAISPSEPDTIFAGGPTGLFRSPDAGKSWLDSGGWPNPLREVDSIAVHPTDPDIVYAGTWQQAYRSDDGGVTWARIGRGMGLDRDIFTIVQSPKDPKRLFAGTCGYLYSSANYGDQWTEHKRGIPSEHRRIHSIAVDPLQKEEIWAGTRGGIYRSLDGAATFDIMYGCVSVSAIMTNSNGSEVLAGTEELGILKSVGGGAFQESNLGLSASKVVAFDTMPGNLKVIVVARTDMPDYQSVHRSSDGGRSWTRLGGTLFEKVRFIRALEDHSQEPVILVICESGRWWSISLDGSPKPVSPPPGKLAEVIVVNDPRVLIAATDSGLYMVGADSLQNPTPAPGKKPLHKKPVQKQAGTGKKKGPGPALKEAGAELGGWRLIRSGAVSAIAVGGDHLLALGPGRAIRFSISEMLAGRLAPEISPVGLPNGVISAAIRPDGGPAAYATTRDQILVSGDWGKSWKPAKLPWPNPELRSIAIDPCQPARVVALDYRGAVFIGGDGERKWRVGGDDSRLHQAQDFRMSAMFPGLAMVATLGHGLRVISLDRFDYDPYDPPPAICPDSYPE